MSAAELLLAAAGEVREANQAELAEAAANAAYLLGVLRQVGTGLGHAPPQQVLASDLIPPSRASTLRGSRRTPSLRSA